MKIYEIFDVIPKIALIGMRLSRLSESDTITEDRLITENEIGDKDYELLIKLAKRGSEHRKVLRFFPIYMDLRASLKWWKHFDTYTFKESLSESTMYNITKDDLRQYNFRSSIPNSYLEYLNTLIDEYNDIKDNRGMKNGLFEAITDLLPSGYLQRRIVMFNYETALNIIKQRHKHKLKEWRIFTDTLQEKLPLLGNLIIDGRV